MTSIENPKRKKNLDFVGLAHELELAAKNPERKEMIGLPVDLDSIPDQEESLPEKKNDDGKVPSNSSSPAPKKS